MFKILGTLAHFCNSEPTSILSFKIDIFTSCDGHMLVDVLTVYLPLKARLPLKVYLPLKVKIPVEN